MSDFIRKDIFAEYVANTVSFIRTMHPSVDPSVIESFVRNRSKERLVNPKVKVIDYPSYGNSQLVEKDLISHINTTRSCILTPSGTAYATTEQHPSFFKSYIDDELSGRKKVKKLMLVAKNAGEDAKAAEYNNEQMKIKVGLNSLPGGMGSAYSFITDISGYNAITSIARGFITYAYAHIERFLESNFFFSDVDHVINHLVCCRRLGPNGDYPTNWSDIKINPATREQTLEFLVSQLKKYTVTDTIDVSPIETMLNAMTDQEVTFVYYMSNIKNIVLNNEDYFSNLLTQLLDRKTDVEDVDTLVDDLEEIWKFDGDMIIVGQTIYRDLFPCKYR